MNAADPKLVQAIADRVMQALASARSQTDCGCGCGGDCADPKKNDEPLARPRPLTGIVTAHRLQDAIKTAPDGVAMLAATARLTPLAQDIARAKPDHVTRLGAAKADVLTGLPWLWWASETCENVRKIVDDRRARLLPVAVPRDRDYLAGAIAAIDDAVATKRAMGALLFVDRAAAALCLANRRRHLRAILGHCDDAVRQGVADVGANVLILESSYHAPDAMARRADLVMAAAPVAPGAMRSALTAVKG